MIIISHRERGNDIAAILGDNATVYERQVGDERIEQVNRVGPGEVGDHGIKLGRRAEGKVVIFPGKRDDMAAVNRTVKFDGAAVSNLEVTGVLGGGNRATRHECSAVGRNQWRNNVGGGSGNERAVDIDVVGCYEGGHSITEDAQVAGIID